MFAGCVGYATAADYPSRPIRLVVGFTAGGPTDIPARFIAERLGPTLGQHVIVENRPGAASTLAANDVMSRPRDGYDLLACTYLDSVNTLLYKNLRYKLADLLGITLVARYSYAVAIANSLPANSFAELIAYAKQRPGEVNYVQLGVASTQHLLAKQLEQLTGISMTAIPYKGAADGNQELISGRVHLHIGPPLSIVPLFKAGKLKVVAVTGDERLPSMPEVPTLREIGVPLVAYAWIGVCAGAGTPQPVVDLLNARIGAIVDSAEFHALMATSGSVAISSTPQEFHRVMEDTAAAAAPIISELGIRLD